MALNTDVMSRIVQNYFLLQWLKGGIGLVSYPPFFPIPFITLTADSIKVQ